MNSAAYARLFRATSGGGIGGGGSNSSHERGAVGESNAKSTAGKLTPVKEVLRRIKWDETLPSSSFAVLYYDRVRDALCESPFDAPNDSISGKETSFVFALPEHRIEAVKYLERTVWHKADRLDRVFGSMNGNGMTIDAVVETYGEWKREPSGGSDNSAGCGEWRAAF